MGYKDESRKSEADGWMKLVHKTGIIVQMTWYYGL